MVFFYGGSCMANAKLVFGLSVDLQQFNKGMLNAQKKIRDLAKSFQITAPSNAYSGLWGFSRVGAQGLHAVCRYHENWISARQTCEQLKDEKALYVAHAGAYAQLDEEQEHCKLAERCERIVQDELNRWIERRHMPAS